MCRDFTRVYADVLKDFLETFADFFQKTKDRSDTGLPAAVQVFRSATGQTGGALSCSIHPNLAGLALNTGQVGFAYGTIGVIMLTLGGLLGGFLAARMV